VADLGLYPGTPIIIERIGFTRYVAETFQGRVDMADPTQVRIILPGPLLQFLPLVVGDEIQLKASLAEGMYRFSGPILDITPTGFIMPYPFATTRLQRREQRRILSEGIVVFAVQGTHGRPTFATVIDLSIGGLQIQAEKWLPVGANLQIEFNLPGGLRGSTAGVVRWKKHAKANSAETRTYCYGIKFVQLDERLRQQIANHIRDYERSMLDVMTQANLSGASQASEG
jgi:c-di-GMP-binding flagellar brake protein YcgR